MSCSWSSDRSESLPGRQEQDLGPLGEPQVLSTALGLALASPRRNLLCGLLGLP